MELREMVAPVHTQRASTVPFDVNKAEKIQVAYYVR